jgi:hypothetical protein
MSVNPPGGPQPLESIPLDTMEGKLCAFYLRSWDQKNTAATNEMERLRELNDRLKLLNELMSPLGTIQAKMGDDNSNGSLIRAVDANPDLLYQINQKMKEAGLKLFPKTQDGKSGPAYEHFGLVRRPQRSGVTEAKMPADLFPHASQWAVKSRMTDNESEWTQTYKAVAENLLNRTLPANPKSVTDQDWNDLARIIFTDAVPDSLPPRTPTVWTNTQGTTEPVAYVIFDERRVELRPSPPIRDEQFVSFVREIGARRITDFGWEMDLRVTGGLNKSFDGPAIFKALQDVKAEISDISNRVQAKTVDVNSALQRASASLNAVVELINRLFGTLGKVLG